jgi:hypothetical protein
MPSQRGGLQIGDFLDSGYSAAELENRIRTANAAHHNAHIGQHLFSGEVQMKMQDPHEAVTIREHRQQLPSGNQSRNETRNQSHHNTLRNKQNFGMSVGSIQGLPSVHQDTRGENDSVSSMNYVVKSNRTNVTTKANQKDVQEAVEKIEKQMKRYKFDTLTLFFAVMSFLINVQVFDQIFMAFTCKQVEYIYPQYSASVGRTATVMTKVYGEYTSVYDSSVRCNGSGL